MTIPSTTPGTLARARTPIAALVGRLAVIGALALAAFGLSVPAASAGEFESISTKRGTVAFNDDSEHVFALDSRRDGLGIQAILTWKDGGRETVLDGGAGGVAETEHVPLREGTTVELKMCYFSKTGLVDCSEKQEAVA